MAVALPWHEQLRRRRLAEMGLTALQLRRPQPQVAGAAATAADASLPVDTRAQSGDAGMSVWLVGDAAAAAALSQLQCVVQATGLSCRVVASDDLAGQPLEQASGLIVLGDMARQRVAALLPLDVQQALPLVFAEEAAALLGSGHAKRALWQQVRMLVRRIGAAPAVPSA